MELAIINGTYRSGNDQSALAAAQLAAAKQPLAAALRKQKQTRRAFDQFFFLFSCRSRRPAAGSSQRSASRSQPLSGEIADDGRRGSANRDESRSRSDVDGFSHFGRLPVNGCSPDAHTSITTPVPEQRRRSSGMYNNYSNYNNNNNSEVQN